MLDAQDIQKLTEILATKDDIRVVDSRLLNLETQFVQFDKKITHLDDRLMVLEEKQDKVIDILDKMIGRMEALNQEYLVLKERDTRYERWFMEIAQKVGITLTP